MAKKDRLLTGAEISLDTLKALGLPDHVTKFAFTVEGGGLVEIHCSYYATVQQGEELLELLQKYNLVPKEADD